MLGLVTIFNPDPAEAAANIRRYVDDLDELVVWDNSSLDKNLKVLLLEALPGAASKIVWKGDGANHFIAPAINYAWHYARQKDFQLLLLMDQDSRWDDFRQYRQQVETLYSAKPKRVFCPFIPGNDTFEITESVQAKRMFINSGTVIPTDILNSIGGADETFGLDALDHDLAIRIQKAGFEIVCLTRHLLHHQLGDLRTMGPLHIHTDNYNAQRTYSISKSHILKIRKHRDWLSADEIKETVKTHYIMKFLRIVLAEPDKWSRMMMLVKGIYDGLTYKFPKK